MTNTITLSEVRQIVRSGETFDLVRCTYDSKREKGGDVEVIKGARAAKAYSHQPMTNSPKRDAHHHLHNTVNIVLINETVITIHWLLIEFFNGKQVIL